MRRFKRPAPDRFDRNKTLGSDATSGPEVRVAGEETWFPAGGSAGVLVTQQTALQYAAVLATVTTLATDTAVMPLEVNQKSAGVSRVAKEHPAHELMARSPNGESTPIRWRQAWMGHALLNKGGYAEIQRYNDGRPYHLHLLDPKSTRPDRDGYTGELFYRTGGLVSGVTRIPAANVLAIGGLGFDGIEGYDVVRLLQQSIGLGIAGDSYAADFFANGAEPGGVIEIPGRLPTDAAVQRIKDGWNSKHGGSGRRHSVGVLEEGAKFNPTSIDPEKTQLNEQRRFQVVDTIRPWRVPPHKIGDMSEAHLANLEESNLDYLMTALMGWLTVIEQECDLKLLTRSEWLAGYCFRHDLKALLRGDLLTRYQTYEIAIRNGWKSRNEVRSEESENPIPDDQGGNAYTVQMQVVPLGRQLAGEGEALPPPPPAEEPTSTDPLPLPEPSNEPPPKGSDPADGEKR